MPQMPAASMRTSTSPGPGSGTGTSTVRMSRVAISRVARITVSVRKGATASRERVEVGVEPLGRAVEPLVDRHHPVVARRPARVGRHLPLEGHHPPDRRGEVGRVADRRRHHRRGADDAAFELARHQVGHAVHARLDPQPELRPRAAARRDEALRPRRAPLQRAERQPHREGHALEHRAVQLGQPVGRPSARRTAPASCGARRTARPTDRAGRTGRRPPPRPPPRPRVTSS